MMLNLRVYFVFFLLFFSFFLSAQTITGYKDSFYQINTSNEPSVCEYDKKYVEKWCIGVANDPLGLYVGFKQLLVYSNDSIQMIDTIRKTIKWELPLENVYKLHIKFPAIITFSTNRTLTGYDYFTGYELWSKTSSYQNMFEAGVDVWAVSKNVIEKLDVFSSEVTKTLPISGKITNIKGDNLYLFVEKDGQLFHLNVVDGKQNQLGEEFSIIDTVSDYVLIGNSTEKRIVTFANEIVSKNVMEELISIHSPTKKMFSYIKNDQIFFVSKEDDIIYDFTRDKKHDKIDYGYKLNEKIRVFSGQEQDLWILKQIEKDKSDQDT